MEFSIGFDYLLILLYKWLCSTITQWHVLPEHSMITWLYHVIWLPNFPMLFISCLHYTIWCWRSNIQIHGKLFPFWGSHNMLILSHVDLIMQLELRTTMITSLCFSYTCVRLANSWAGIKPTAPLSVFDKENSMEFLLDFLYYLYKCLTLTLC